MVTLIIPTLTRYDTLLKCISGAFSGSVPVDRVIVIDNGCKLVASSFEDKKVDIVSFGYNIGVAAAWNFGINNSSEIRIISNDDIEFGNDTVEKIIKNYDPTTINCFGVGSPLNAFSLFTFPDVFINTIGLFDETISPNYAYFEDNDYYYRMKLEGKDLYRNPEVVVNHVGSATVKSFSKEDLDAHHKKFQIAANNYRAKWGGGPEKEVFRRPYGIS